MVEVETEFGQGAAATEALVQRVWGINALNEEEDVAHAVRAGRRWVGVHDNLRMRKIGVEANPRNPRRDPSCTDERTWHYIPYVHFWRRLSQLNMVYGESKRLLGRMLGITSRSLDDNNGGVSALWVGVEGMGG